MSKTHRNNLRWREHQFHRVYDVIRERTQAERAVTYKIPHVSGDPVDLPFKYRKACNIAFKTGNFPEIHREESDKVCGVAIGCDFLIYSKAFEIILKRI